MEKTMEKSTEYRVEVDEERKTFTDPETGKEWPVYFDQPEDFEVIESLVEQLNEECRKRLIPCVIWVVSSHHPDGCNNRVSACLPGPRAPLSIRKLALEAQGQSPIEGSGAHLLAALKALFK